ncbi:hypothetical protein EJ03DRAFT_377136 [Teratosphaeria nubilosa]|uniref:Uncharacterized protein n=1 Tax=Teratosphaeria nubilosa TaxID=161662 RepID=A0A6G1L138_9PEZI|nr:hypothetical protein EJ03DRAFT_377136 [Teratosphaeria nubilosa]
MIKTHKPRGHFWVGASVFQRSKEIRKITFEDCTPPEDDEVLYPDSDGDLSANERSAKRRRIEQLADDFLNGKPLTIQSARPHCQSLKVAIEYNERSRTGKQYSLEVTRKREGNDAVIWEDVDELATTSAGPDEAKRSRSKGKGRAPAKRFRVATKTQAIEREQASSACRQVRHRNVKLTTEPSTAARQQAAVLRDRSMKRAATDVPAMTEVIDESPPEQGVHSGPSTMARPRYFRNRKPPSTEWLLRQNTALYELKADESFDELTRSPVESTPSRPSQKPKAEYVSVPDREGSDCKGVSEPCSTDDLAKSQGQNLQRAVAVPEAIQEYPSNDDAIIGGRRATELAATASGVEENGPEMQTPVTAQGDNVRRAQSSNAFVSRRIESQAFDHSQGSIEPDNTVQSAVPRPAYTALTSSDESGTPFMFRKRRTRANPTGAAAVARKPIRKDRGKKTSRASDGTSAPTNYPPPVASAAPPVLDMSISHDSSFGMRLNMALADEPMKGGLLADPISDGRSSSSGTALREEFRNAGADVSFDNGEAQSSQNAAPRNHDHESSGVKVATGGVGDYGRAPECSGTADEAAVTQWPGTQMALYQAQRDLFPSPAKFHGDDGCAVHLTPGPNNSPPASAPPANPPARPLLRELSQESQLPSTQALMTAWSPWSAVKKTKQGTASMTVPSPSAPPIGFERAARSSRLSVIDSEPATSFSLGNERRRSSLRFSVTSEHLSTPKMQFSVTKSASQEGKQLSGEKSEDAAFLEVPTATNNEPHKKTCSSDPSFISILREHLVSGAPGADATPINRNATTVVDAAVREITVRNDMDSDATAGIDRTSSSMPAGQAHAALAFRDDSQPERTIAGLGEDLFASTREMDGIASQ